VFLLSLGLLLLLPIAEHNVINRKSTKPNMLNTGVLVQDFAIDILDQLITADQLTPLSNMAVLKLVQPTVK